MEGYINLFVVEDTQNNRPHYRGNLKIDGVKHEFALWPNRDGKQGFSGKYKIKPEDAKPLQNPELNESIPEDTIPF